MPRREIASGNPLPGGGGAFPTRPKTRRPPGEVPEAFREVCLRGNSGPGGRAGYLPAAGGFTALGTFSQSARNFLMPASVSGWLASWVMTL